ncbi:MAG: acid shock protein [Candidatus Pacearchaeota archaeon]
MEFAKRGAQKACKRKAQNARKAQMARKVQKARAQKAQLSSFAWIFSLIIGAVILFFAFFFVTQYGKQVAKPTKEVSVESGINILLEPFSEVGSLVEAQGTALEFPADSYTEFGCNANNDYSEIKWRNRKEKTFSIIKQVPDKYIFSKPLITTQKETFFAFSMPLKDPFFIATPVIIVDGKYCLTNLPYQYRTKLEEISKDIISKTKSAINFTNCPSDYYKIDIGCSACNYGFVDGKPWFSDLIYAAIFSDFDTYNCNLDRILARAKILASIYKTKAQLLRNKGCTIGNIEGALDSFITAIDTFMKSKTGNNLGSLYNSIVQLRNINAGLVADCKLF